MSNVEGVNQFKAIGHFKMLLLTLVTLGFYLPYWIITRSQRLHDLTQGRTRGLILSYVVALMFCVWLLGQIVPVPGAWRLGLSVLMQVLNLSLLVWSFWFRACWNQYVDAEKGSLLWNNLFYAWFALMFYHQIKINQRINAG